MILLDELISPIDEYQCLMKHFLSDVWEIVKLMNKNLIKPFGVEDIANPKV